MAGRSEREKQARYLAARKRAKSRPAAPPKPAAPAAPTKDGDARCGLCGKTENLVRTECCGNWICDDEHKYVMFSYARNSCRRNHRRFTLCGSHHSEGHAGDWKTCQKCRDAMETEMYVHFGTNEYNFEVLPTPPKYRPTKCHKCGRTIALSKEEHVYGAEGYTCMKCAAAIL